MTDERVFLAATIHPGGGIMMLEPLFWIAAWLYWVTVISFIA